MSTARNGGSGLPRLLLMSSEPPHTLAAGSTVLRRLLLDYPADKLLVLSNNAVPQGAMRLACRYERMPLLADRLQRTRLWPWRAALRVLGGSTCIRLERIDRLLRGFRPEVVATLMQDSWFYDIAARFARRRRLPMALVAHDLPHVFEPVAPPLRSRQLRRDAGVYRQAAARLCISEGMAEFFEARFGALGEVLLPPASEERIAQPPERCERLKSDAGLVLGYAGGLHYGYGEQLLAMLPALRRTGTRVELFGPRPTGVLEPLLAAGDVLRFNGYESTPEAAWRRLLAGCDALLQPYLDPPGPHALQYRTHFPSKLADALALGLPIVVTGPADASGVRWLRQHPDAALWVDQAGTGAIAAALERLRDDGALRVRLARGAQAAAHAFAADPLRQQLREALVRIREGHR